ncbi:hypothetical protein MG293_002244 [Ovis ammon polii]|uniref:Aquaporin n=1 Tax=Ovis ammon polii TaxID=230172 RepID=A0AAD4UR85_OVIAM|nr:hypothetical protein MG293_002244 [Ovis ammon polii]
MAGLNVSLCFFLATFALCQVVRRAAKALLPGGTYAHFAREAAGTAQLGACCLEMRMLVELGPWALGFGPDLLLTLVFLLLLVHGATLDGASANPTVSLQRFLLAEASLPSTLLELVAQALGVQAAGALTRLYWAWGLSDLHVLQSLMDPHCSSALRTAAPHGALLEGSCAFLLHLALLRLQGSRAVHRAPAMALLLTAAAGTAGPLTSAFLNPTLAASVTFRCSGHSLLEYLQVYWLGPVTACQASLSITSSHSPLKLIEWMSLESVMLSNRLSPCRPLLLPPSVFPNQNQSLTLTSVGCHPQLLGLQGTGLPVKESWKRLISEVTPPPQASEDSGPRHMLFSTKSFEFLLGAAALAIREPQEEMGAGAVAVLLACGEALCLSHRQMAALDLPGTGVVVKGPDAASSLGHINGFSSGPSEAPLCLAPEQRAWC